MTKKEKRFSLLTIGLSILPIVYTTLYPFDFDFTQQFEKKGWHLFFLGFGETDLFDYFVNILLFVPFGVAITAYLLREKRLSFMTAFPVTYYSGFVMSYCIEMSQVFMPSRFPAFFDVLTNSFGAANGFLVFWLWQLRGRLLFAGLAKWSTRLIDIASSSAVKRMPLVIGGYVVWVISITFVFPLGTRLQNWNPEFPLMIGNEHTGDRPWEGTVSEILLYDRTLSNAHIARLFSGDGTGEGADYSPVVSYVFRRESSHSITGHLFPLRWKGEREGVLTKSGIAVGHGAWLESTEAAEILTKKLRGAGQFSLYIKAAAHDLSQTGPARIISVSKDPSNRNFTLGQWQQDLVFRLRTPLTGENGTKPQMTVPRVFSDTNLHKIIVNYDGAALSIYIDEIGNRHVLGLAPREASLGYWHMKNARLLVFYKIAYYAGIFLPLGLILSLMGRKYKRRYVICGTGVLLPPFFLEVSLLQIRKGDFRTENLFLGTGIIVLVIALFYLFQQLMLRFSRLSYVRDEKNI